MDIGNIEIATIGGIDIQPSPSQAQSISSTQHKQYRKEGRCVWCSSQDHWVSKCPFAPYSSGKKVTIAALNDDDNSTESDADSWNSKDMLEMQRLG
jgi:hypothetical protein